MAPVDDTIPHRNLPGEAENWGRQVENRISGLSRSSGILTQSVLSQSRTNASTLSLLSSRVERLRVNAGITYSESGYLEFYRDPAPSSPYYVESWLISAPDWAQHATVFSLGWTDVTGVNAGGSGGSAYPYVYVRPAGDEFGPSQGWPLLTDALVDPFGSWQDSPYPVPTPVSGGGIYLDFWVLRVDSGGVYEFSLDWDLLIQWF